MLIMTYNIRGGRGIDGKQSLPRIADVIRASGADVACLQEVEQRMPRSLFVDQPKWLGERLGMAFVFQRNLSFMPGGFGNLILTRYPVMETKSHGLTSAGEQRGLVAVTLAAPDGPLSVFCTHWGLSTEERMIQSTETAAVVKTLPRPRIFCGDLNDIDDTIPITNLLATANLHDLATDTEPHKLTFPADNPTARIDYIFGSSDVIGVRSEVVETPASDHRPVVVEVQFLEAA
jgi:endonuclease/exonuclease/phosphatase family metal-dependent hydrolase